MREKDKNTHAFFFTAMSDRLAMLSVYINKLEF